MLCWYLGILLAAGTLDLGLGRSAAGTEGMLDGPVSLRLLGILLATGALVCVGRGLDGCSPSGSLAGLCMLRQR